MPLDPMLATFLEVSKDQPSVEAMPVEEARARMDERVAPLKAFAPAVGSVEERTVDGPGGPLRLRLYRPTAGGDALPVIVYIHGGGWVLCSLETHDNLCRSLCEAAGAAVVSVDYRLAPEHRFPAAVDDSLAGVEWAAANAASLGGDPAKLVVAGDSAGGNLAAAVALRARDAGAPRIAGQLLIYPVTDLPSDVYPSYAENDAYGLTRAAMEHYWREYIGPGDATHPHAAVLRAPDVAGLPPAFVLTAQYDGLRDEGEAYAAKLRAAGIPTALKRYDGVNHGFVSLAGMFEPANAAIRDIVDWLRSNVPV
jgi:acetyl esterase